MNYYNELFREYAKKWNKTPDVCRFIFLVLDFSGHNYAEVSKSLNNLGFQISERKLRYFYKKIVLTSRYGDKKKIGSKNYRNLVYRKI